MMTWLLLLSGLLMALLSGVFLSFSDFVMRGLMQASAQAGSAGMVGLNRTVYRSVFMVLFVGFVPAAIGLSVWAFLQVDGPALVPILLGCMAYVAGVFAVTGFGNVPMNNRLDALAERADARAAYWPDYADRWTRLNHLRTAASAFAAAMWLIASNLL
ncbi:DUF1772 domain-containing protein [Yoonia algicola]|uniref:Anthrone oxygenase family protein n=1 Tax=Yoonia algicola TaxID=3137368 RepID=A0AAN0M2T4_9RHOB